MFDAVVEVRPSGSGCATDMAVESWHDFFLLFKRQVPDVFIKRRFNFITLHYLYMIGMSLLLSVIIYGMGGMAYIDALFFASGACTQSGLNTIDVDLIRTGQQLVLYLGGMMCNPIVVHSFVVFVRLYWFEKRFKDWVRDARSLRRTKSRARNNTISKEDAEQGSPQPGVGGRVIQVLRHTGRSGHPDADQEKVGDVEPNGKAVESSDTASPRPDRHPDRPGPLRALSSDNEMPLPLQLSPEQHIRFLENQRHPKDTALRIPSPREFERGGRPESVDTDDSGDGGGGLVRQTTSNPEQNTAEPAPRGEGTAARGHIIIDEPQLLRERTRDRTSTLPRLNTRQSTNPRAEVLPSVKTRRSNTFSSLRRANTARSIEAAPYLSYQPTIGRNSFFVNLTQEQREELGGVEYRALKTLALILVIYFFGFHLLGLICLVPWILHTDTYGRVVEAQGQGRVWWGIFTSASAFNDLGFTLTNNSMISFAYAIFPLLLMTFLIVIGNTGFPCMLRLLIWLSSKCVPVGSAVWEELHFLLDHPRRCFTLLFPRGATWWLFAILIILNGIDLLFFFILDLNDPTVTSLPGGIRFVDGLFQASSTRTAGFAVVNLADLHPAIQVSYLIMMYISVFPIAISMRRTNVYEEKSLGIYGRPEDEDGDDDGKEPSYVGAHLRRQLSFDLWYIFLGMFIIAVVEGGQLQNTNEYAFTLFSVLFEIVSAYGTVGMSLGYPTINASFSAEFHTLSKLVIIAMQIRGRHRGLPYELDRAILLPSESLHATEAQESERIMRRRRSSLGAPSTMSAVDGQMDSHKYRPETGLASGFRFEDNHQARERGNLTRIQSETAASGAEHHQNHAAQEAAMFRLASAPGVTREEMGFVSDRQ